MKSLGLAAEGVVLFVCSPDSSFLGRLSLLLQAWDWSVSDQGVLCLRTLLLFEILKKCCHCLVIRRNRLNFNGTLLCCIMKIFNFEIVSYFRKVTKIVQSASIYPSSIPNVHIQHNHSVVIKVRKRIPLSPYY